MPLPSLDPAPASFVLLVAVPFLLSVPSESLLFQNLSQLFQALTERLSGEVAQHTLRLPPQEGRLRSRFYQLQAIEKEWMEEDGSVSLQVRMPIVDWCRLCKQEPALIDYLI